jgi:hypothetical protein
MRRPYPAPIVPGGLFVTNSIFQASDICLNLEYATQNRILSNWFVSQSGVVLRLKNTNKTWFVANEINQFRRAAILLEDDQGGGNFVHNNIIALNWMHSEAPETAFFEVIHGEKMHDILITNNILEGSAKVQLPPLTGGSGNRFQGNVRHTTMEGESALLSENAGTAVIPAGQRALTVEHGLLAKPVSLSLTPQSDSPPYWVANCGEKSFEIHLRAPTSAALPFLWRAALAP